MSILAFRMQVRNVDCTISDAAKEACEIAERFQVPIVFEFDNIECEASYPWPQVEHVVNAYIVDVQAREREASKKVEAKHGSHGSE